MFNRWHPQLALRYLPIVRYIKNSGLVNPSILEVGSGSLGIGPYLKKEFTGADIEFSGPKWPQKNDTVGEKYGIYFFAPLNAVDKICVIRILNSA